MTNRRFYRIKYYQRNAGIPGWITDYRYLDLDGLEKYIKGMVREYDCEAYDFEVDELETPKPKCSVKVSFETIVRISWPK